MAPNPIVIAKANTLYPELQFNFMTWIQGSCVPALVCAAALPLLLAWSCGLWKSKPEDEEGSSQLKIDGDNIVEHAAKELKEMGTLSLKEVVCKKKKKSKSNNIFFFIYLFLAATLFCASGLSCFMGHFGLYKNRFYTGCLNWYCSFVTHGNSSMVRCSQ